MSPPPLANSLAISRGNTMPQQREGATCGKPRAAPQIDDDGTRRVPKHRGSRYTNFSKYLMVRTI